MNVARLTATRVHQRLGICPLLSASCTSHMYGAPVRITCTTYMAILTCTAYSCQAMAQTAVDEGRTRLSKAAVIDRALALSDAEGLDALTIRRLATELGVTPMALYWHFRSKEELLGGLADRIWAEIDTDVDPAADWPQQLRGMLQSLVQVLRAHPCASQILLSGEKLSSYVDPPAT